MLKILVVLTSALCVVYAALSISPLEPKPKKFEGQEGCYIKNLDAVIPFGKSMPSKTSCMEYRCGKTIVTHVTCGTVSTRPPCKVVRDEGKPYPGCCPRVECP